MRLNKEIRSKIVDNAYLESSIPAAKKELTARSVALSEKIRLASLETPTLDDDLKSAEKEIKLILKKRGIPDTQAPDRLFRRSGSMYVRLGDENVNVYLSGSMEKTSNSRSDTVILGDSSIPYKFTGKVSQNYDANHPFTQEYRKLRDDAIQLQEDEKVLRNTVQATVDSFYTIEKLLEQWPEAKVLIPKDVERASAPMPLALQTDVLNNLIGLPK